MQAIEQRDIEPSRKTHVVTKLKHPLPSPDVSFDRHFEMLKAYVAASKEGRVPVSYTEFGKLTVSPYKISANNKFFERLNLITRVEGTPGKYIPTPDAIELCRDLAWKREAKVKSRLAELVSKSWFGESARTLLATREKVTESELLEKLGYDSGADPRKHTRSLRVLVEYLKFSEILKEQDGVFVTSDFKLSSMDTNEERVPLASGGPMEVRQVQQLGRRNMDLLFGVLVTPESSEEQIRNAIRIVLEEIRK